jgi:hypothetical protein
MYSLIIYIFCTDQQSTFSVSITLVVCNGFILVRIAIQNKNAFQLSFKIALKSYELSKTTFITNSKGTIRICNNLKI